MTHSVIFLIPSFYRRGELDELPSPIHLVCALTMLCSSQCPQALQDLPICSLLGQEDFGKDGTEVLPFPQPFVGSCLLLDWASCPTFGSLPSLWVFTQPMGFHLAFGFSPSLWIFTQPLGLRSTFLSLPDLWVFTRPLGLHPTFGSSPSLWVFTQPLVFTQLFKAEACCCCNRMNPVYLFIFIVLNWAKVALYNHPLPGVALRSTVLRGAQPGDMETNPWKSLPQTNPSQRWRVGLAFIQLDFIFGKYY